MRAGCEAEDLDHGLPCSYSRIPSMAIAFGCPVSAALRRTKVRPDRTLNLNPMGLSVRQGGSGQGPQVYLAACEGAVGHDAVAWGQGRLGVADVAEDGGEVAEGTRAGHLPGEDRVAGRRAGIRLGAVDHDRQAVPVRGEG